MNLLIYFFTCLLFLCTMGVSFGCKKKLGEPHVQGFVIDSNDMVESNSANADMNRIPMSEIRATGSVTSVEGGKVHFCTGFVIAPANPDSHPRIITNYHCFTNDGKNEGAFAPWACTSTKIFLGLVKEDPTLLTVAECKPNSLRGHPQADIAVFEVAAPLPPEIKPLELESTPFTISQQAHVVHHPFIAQNIMTPMNHNQKAATSMTTAMSCGTSFPIHELRKRPDTGFLFDQSHSCDIVDGSSGAPVIDANTGRVIAVNWGGITWRNERKHIENRGVDAAWVAAYLENRLQGYETAAYEIILANQNANSSDLSHNTSEESTASRTKKLKWGGCAIQ